MNVVKYYKYLYKVEKSAAFWNEFLAGTLANEQAKNVCEKIQESVHAIESLKAEIEKIKAEPSEKTIKEVASEVAKDVGAKVSEVAAEVKEKVGEAAEEPKE